MPPAHYLFSIGTTLETLTYLAEFTNPILSVKSQHFDYARTVNLGSGGKRGTGWPMHLWTIGLPTPEMRNELKVYCPGTSASVYIYTKINDKTWETFLCNMLWPEEEKWWFGDKESILVWFRTLQLIEGS